MKKIKCHRDEHPYYSIQINHVRRPKSQGIAQVIPQLSSSIIHLWIIENGIFIIIILIMEDGIYYHPSIINNSHCHPLSSFIDEKKNPWKPSPASPGGSRGAAKTSLSAGVPRAHPHHPCGQGPGWRSQISKERTTDHGGWPERIYKQNQ